MKTRAIVQIDPQTGQKNVTFTTDDFSPVEDFLIPWPKSEVIDGYVLILAMDGNGIVDQLIDTEFRSVDSDMSALLAVPQNPGGIVSDEWDQYVRRYVATIPEAKEADWEGSAKRLIDSMNDGTQDESLF